MQPGRVVVDLDLREKVYVGFAGQFGGGDFVEGAVDVVGQLRIEEAHAAVDVAELQQAP